MTIEEIRKRIDEIKAAADDVDNEKAHAIEDELHRAVLQAIANGECADPAACAAEALKTKNITFTRWYA